MFQGDYCEHQQRQACEMVNPSDNLDSLCVKFGVKFRGNFLWYELVGVRDDPCKVHGGGVQVRVGIISFVLDLKYLSQNSINFSMLGLFWNPQDEQFLKLSLDLHLEQYLKEILRVLHR